MKERRYKDSYKIVTDVDPGTGKPREVAVYRGDYYAFPEGALALRRRALRVGALVALYWLFALIYLMTGRASTRCAYALLPFMLGLLPGFYALLGLIATLRAPVRMTVIQRENGPGRLVRSCVSCGALSAAGALGCAVFLSLNGLWAGEWTDALLTAAASASAWSAFTLCRRDYRRLGKQPPDPPADAGAAE